MAKTRGPSIQTELLRESREAALNAVQAFNNPRATFKTETFIVLMVIAWTRLLHAYYRREGIEYRYFERGPKRRRFKRLAQNRASKLGDGEDTGEDTRERKSDTWGILPDLVLIDGGKGQLSAALEVLLELGMDDVPLASLAKENEWLYVPHTPEPIILPRDSQALYLVQRMRDEAHRFAITYHRNLRSKSSLRSPIDMVTGIGPERKRMLMRRFGTLQGIKQASVEDIASVPGMTRSMALRLKQTI